MAINDLLFERLDGSDDFLGRLTQGQLIVIAGKPAFGKTALAARIINNLAINDGVSVALFSLELYWLYISGYFANYFAKSVYGVYRRVLTCKSSITYLALSVPVDGEIQSGYKNGRKRGQNPLKFVSKDIKKACSKARCTNEL